MRTPLGVLRGKFGNTYKEFAERNCYIMKKIIITLLFVMLAILFVSMFMPTSLVAETPAIDLALQIEEQQKADPLFNKIGECESQNDPLADNLYSTAKGRFQFLDGTWRHYAPKLWGIDWVNKNVFDYKDNTDLAWFVYTKYGTADWEADPKSYECWKSEIPNALYKNIY